jgi:WD40 repeat protein
MAFSGDGSQVLLEDHGDKSLKMLDAATGRLLRTFAGHTGIITDFALSHDGTRALTSSTDRTVKLWEVATGRLLQTFESFPERVSLSPDGHRAMLGNALRPWSVFRNRVS